MTAVELHTGAWYGDVPLALQMPESWDVTTHWPTTPGPVGPAEIAGRLASPVGRPRLRELAVGKAAPVILVDDLTRPTPADAVLPLLLEELRQAGIDPSHVTIVAATGTHGSPGRDALVRKIGREAASICRFLVHDDQRDLVRVGRTSFGTPVHLNREVAAADLVVGIGGIYPQHAVGFGGGSKIALGVLGRRTIARLHYRHPSMSGAYVTDNAFRRDLDEIAQMIGLLFVCSLLVDARRQIVRVVCGDPARFHSDEVEFAKANFAAPAPGDADVVIANTYPMDVSVTFMRSKGVVPLLGANPRSSKVLVAACSEGLGHHGLYPFVNASRRDELLAVARTLRARPGAVPAKVAARIAAPFRRRVQLGAGAARPRTALGTVSAFPIHLFATQAPDLPPAIRGMVTHRSWESVQQRIEQEQGVGRPLRVVVYPCAPLQVIREADDL